MLCSEPVQRKPQRAAGGRVSLATLVLALNKAHVLALNTPYVLRLITADVLSLNKAHVLHLNEVHTLRPHKNVLLLHNKMSSVPTIMCVGFLQ